MAKEIPLHEQDLHEELSRLLRATLDDRLYRHSNSNFLNSIQYMISLGDKDLAMSYVAHCNKLIRKIELFSKQKPIISLESEIMLLELYLKLSTMRRQDQLRWEMEVPSEINLFDIAFPPLLVFPSVEFAVTCSNIGRINFHMEKDYLVVKIKSNGELDPLDFNWHFGGGRGSSMKRLELWNGTNLCPKPNFIEGEGDELDITIYIRPCEY